jgi:hypothetical protein
MKSLLPFLFVLVCPLMMVFMMRGMHGHGADAKHADRAPNQEPMTAGELNELRDNLEMQMVALNERIDSLGSGGASPENGEGQIATAKREALRA